VKLIDHSMDASHNRAVVTLVGPGERCVEAAFAAIAKAKDVIDLNQHKGEHPRIGATDVVPFVPLEGSTLRECVALAYRLGARVGKELEIPVYYYEAAAKTPARKNLPDVRNLGYEKLRDAGRDRSDARAGRRAETALHPTAGADRDRRSACS
jgi:glutamate formiminotransferase